MPGALAVNGGALFIAVFLACVVEAVEALTIVLAAGFGRDWRSAIPVWAGSLAVLRRSSRRWARVHRDTAGGLRLGRGWSAAHFRAAVAA